MFSLLIRNRRYRFRRNDRGTTVVKRLFVDRRRRAIGENWFAPPKNAPGIVIIVHTGLRNRFIS